MKQRKWWSGFHIIQFSRCSVIYFLFGVVVKRRWLLLSILKPNKHFIILRIWFYTLVNVKKSFQVTKVKKANHVCNKSDLRTRLSSCDSLTNMQYEWMLKKKKKIRKKHFLTMSSWRSSVNCCNLELSNSRDFRWTVVSLCLTRVETTSINTLSGRRLHTWKRNCQELGEFLIQTEIQTCFSF